MFTKMQPLLKQPKHQKRFSHAEGNITEIRDGRKHLWNIKSYDATTTKSESSPTMLEIKGELSITSDHYCVADGNYTISTVYPIALDKNGDPVGGAFSINDRVSTAPPKVDQIYLK